jgi:hypothetical protein
LDKLLSHALIPTEKKNIITNMQYLNLQIIQDQSRVCYSFLVFLWFFFLIHNIQRESGVSPDLGRATALHVASELFIKSGVILFFHGMIIFFYLRYIFLYNF